MIAPVVLALVLSQQMSAKECAENCKKMDSPEMIQTCEKSATRDACKKIMEQSKQQCVSACSALGKVKKGR